ncbi:hypothetical protein M0R04_04870 [Candidatus Dojkabacteria bacterium]|jgi:hypothetical protein|nr:hypothetical protein [Candidatus Dojkabacteria bacterium]
MTVDSLTYIYSENGRPLVCIYRKFNSYPSIHGKAIYDFLEGRKVVDNDDDIEYKSNMSMGCLAAEFIGEFKKGILDIKLLPTDTQYINQAFSYHIYKDQIVVKNYQGYIAFTGTWEDFKTFITPDE